MPHEFAGRGELSGLDKGFYWRSLLLEYSLQPAEIVAFPARMDHFLANQITRPDNG